MATRSTTARVALIAFLVAAVPIVARQAPGGASGLKLSAPIHHLFDDRLAREPMIVEHPTGTLFVAGYGMLNRPTNVETPNLWKSTDGGKTFIRVNVGTTEQGALGNSDVDLAVAADGTLYFVSMTFDRIAGHQILMRNSRPRHAPGSFTWARAVVNGEHRAVIELTGRRGASGVKGQSMTGRHRLQMSVLPNVAGHAVAGAGFAIGLPSTSDCR